MEKSRNRATQRKSIQRQGKRLQEYLEGMKKTMRATSKVKCRAKNLEVLCEEKIRNMMCLRL